MLGIFGFDEDELWDEAYAKIGQLGEIWHDLDDVFQSDMYGGSAVESVLRIYNESLEDGIDEYKQQALQNLFELLCPPELKDYIA